MIEAFEKIIKPHILAKYFTHVYAECGYCHDKPVFVYKHLPDKRTVFDLGSITKAIVTTPLILKEVYSKNLTLSATVGDFKELFRGELNPKFYNITIEQLLAHTSGLPAWRNFYVCNLAHQNECICDISHKKNSILICGINRAAEAIKLKPEFCYSDVGFILLGDLLEKTQKKTLSDVFSKFCEDELKVKNLTQDCGYQKQVAKLATRAVSTGYCAVRARELIGEVHDENCAALNSETGHAGIFASGEALSKLIKTLLGSRVGEFIFLENAKKLKSPPNSSLLGWRQGSLESAGSFSHGQALGHLGFTGTAFWISNDMKRYGIFLTNRVVSGRVSSLIQSIRSEVFSFFEDLFKSKKAK